MNPTTLFKLLALATLTTALTGGPVNGRTLPVVLRDEHYLARTGNHKAGGFRYVLLSSYEQRLRELERQQQ